MGSKNSSGIIFTTILTLLIIGSILWSCNSQVDKVEPNYNLSLIEQQATATAVVNQMERAESRASFMDVFWRLFLIAFGLIAVGFGLIGLYSFFVKVQIGANRQRVVETADGKHYLVTSKTIIDPTRQFGPGTVIGKDGTAYPTGMDLKYVGQYAKTTQRDQEILAGKKGVESGSELVFVPAEEQMGRDYEIREASEFPELTEEIERRMVSYGTEQTL